MTSVPYEKGALLLRSHGAGVGRERFDAFLRGYFDHFAFQSITTAIFVDYLQKHLLNGNTSIPLDEWLTKPGLPASAPKPVSDALTKWRRQRSNGWRGRRSKPPAGRRRSGSASSRRCRRRLPAAKMWALDRTFSFTKSGNSEILEQWLLMSVQNHYEPAYPRLEEFLVDVGRRKFLKPLYEELVKTPEGRARAEAIYKKARPGYHPIAVTTVDGILAPKKTP